MKRFLDCNLKVTLLAIILPILWFSQYNLTIVAASASISTQHPFFIASDIAVPIRPTPPTPPSVSKLKENSPAKETQQPNKPPSLKDEPEKKAVNFQSTEAKPEKSANKVPPQSKEQPLTKEKPLTPEEILKETAEPQNDESLANQEKKATEVKPFTPFMEKIIYSMIMIFLLSVTAYLYLTTPKKTINSSAQQSKANSSRSTIGQVQKTSIMPTIPDFPKQNKIKNTSLLEQLVKYDMETYGELRSNLDYEQPAYVEQLIRKYARGDQNQINRAIHLFYTHRNKKWL